MKNKLKKKFEKFFKLHPTIKKLPFLLTIVIPKYECKGERVVNNMWDILEDEDCLDKFLEPKVEDTRTLYNKIDDDLPSISDKDAFYIFDEDIMVVVHNTPEGVIFEEIDFSNEIHDMY